MEVANVAGGGGSGPAPFLLKTYDMVDDSSTDGIVSWSSSRNSFVVWNPPEFARLLLPTYFKHNNFSSFIRQLNTYGFRKIDPERWEFGNEDFVKDQKHLLKNIHRRKPIHSHSNPQGSLADPERAALDEEIDKLSREKATLETNVSRFNQQQSIAKIQLEDLTQRVIGMEQRQETLHTFLEKEIQNPIFVEHLTRKIESMDISAFNKKRRLPQISQIDQVPIVAENSFVENNHSSSRCEFGNLFHQDFSDKLNLELSPSVSDVNLVTHSTQSSNEEVGSSRRNKSEGDLRTEGLLELSDTGTSFAFRTRKEVEKCLGSNEEGDGQLSCHLNLTLASSPLQLKNKEADATTLSFKQEAAPVTNQGAPAVQARVNDVFWEHFLTERPGSLENEDATSNFRANSNEEQEDRRSGLGVSENSMSVNQLTL